MATYKVLQDIEAEDKIVGPLSLKQFIFAFVAAAILGVGWFVGGRTNQWAFAAFVVPALPFIFLAAPLGRDQPNDVWLGAKLRFWFKPRVRKWSQSVSQEFVTITSPKKEEHTYTDGLSHQEVRSRLQTLANTMDSRGQLVSDANGNMITPQTVMVDSSQSVSASQPSDDLLYESAEITQNQESLAMTQKFQALLDNQSKFNREAAIVKMQSVASEPTAVSSGSTAEAEFLDSMHSQQERLINTQVVQQPVEAQLPPVAAVVPPEHKQLDSGIIKELAEADDLKVSTIATMANKSKDKALLHDNEVINLH